MSALSVIQSTLINFAAPLVTNTTGGTSEGNPSAGTSKTSEDPFAAVPATNADKAGAGFVTALVIALFLCVIAFMVTGG
jgi:mannan endo-1,6-alpha-mannosidase